VDSLLWNRLESLPVQWSLFDWATERKEADPGNPRKSMTGGGEAMEPPISPNPGASPFFYGPHDGRRGSADKHRPLASNSASQTGASHAGPLARDIRATVEANRTRRPPEPGAKAFKRSARGVITVLALSLIVGTVATGVAVAGKPQVSCAVSPNPVVSGTTLTISGRTGGGGSWVNAYIYYSDGYWGFLGGSVSGGSFSLSGLAQETHTSYWGPFYPAASGAASVQIYAGTANKNLGMVETCSFSVS
jgi:hypothetical protein